MKFAYPSRRLVVAGLTAGASGLLLPRIALGGVGSHPIDAAATVNAIRGKKLTEGLIDEAAALAYGPAKPLDNTDFAMAWRKDMSKYYVTGALRELAGLPPQYSGERNTGHPQLKVL